MYLFYAVYLFEDKCDTDNHFPSLSVPINSNKGMHVWKNVIIPSNLAQVQYSFSSSLFQGGKICKECENL